MQLRDRSHLPRKAFSSKPEKKRDDDEEDPSKQKKWSMRETVSWFNKKSKPNNWQNWEEPDPDIKEKNTNYPDREKTKAEMLTVLREKPKKEESLETTKPKAKAKAGFTPGAIANFAQQLVMQRLEEVKQLESTIAMLPRDHEAREALQATVKQKKD